MIGSYTGTGKVTGKRLDLDVVHVWNIRDRKLARCLRVINTGKFRRVVAVSPHLVGNGFGLCEGADRPLPCVKGVLASLWHQTLLGEYSVDLCLAPSAGATNLAQCRTSSCSSRSAGLLM